MKARYIYLFVLVTTFGCNDQDVVPILDSFPLVSSITSYEDQSSTSYRISSYFYDNQNRLIRELNEGGSWLTPSSVTYEYVGDRQINISSGSQSYEIHLNSHGDPIKINEDTYSYVYEPNRIEVTVTSDSETWVTVYTISENNVIKTEEAESNHVTLYTFDDQPNYRKCFEFTFSYSNANNTISMTMNDYFEVVNNYVYNDQGYVSSYTTTSTYRDSSTVRKYEIEYYQ